MTIDLLDNPYTLFHQWMKEAEEKEVNDPNAMSLATVGRDGQPSVRIVLLKDLTDEGFCFYTNSQSQKGVELAENPAAALLFHWKSLRRQVRIEGTATLLPDAAADAYFASRPRGSRIGAWVSQQSRPLVNYQTLKDETDEKTKSFAGNENIPRPDYWKGYVVAPRRIEFWVDGEFRLHERYVFERAGDGWTAPHMIYP